MTFEYRLPVRRRALPAFDPSEPIEAAGPPAQLARLLALSHQLEAKVRTGQVMDYDELAKSSGVSPARITQIAILSQLAPAIQEYVLFLSIEYAGLITEIQLREIAREIRWDRQVALFRELVARRS
jgi:hypothetical protein